MYNICSDGSDAVKAGDNDGRCELRINIEEHIIRQKRLVTDFGVKS